MLTDHFSKSGSNPPPVRPTLHTHTDIQTDGDCTKRVVTSFGTTRLKTHMRIVASGPVNSSRFGPFGLVRRLEVYAGRVGAPPPPRDGVAVPRDGVVARAGDADARLSGTRIAKRQIKKQRRTKQRESATSRCFRLSHSTSANCCKITRNKDTCHMQ